MGPSMTGVLIRRDDSTDTHREVIQRHWKEMAVYGPRREVPKDTNPTDTLTLDFSASITHQIHFRCVSHPVSAIHHGNPSKLARKLKWGQPHGLGPQVPKPGPWEGSLTTASDWLWAGHMTHIGQWDAASIFLSVGEGHPLLTVGELVGARWKSSSPAWRGACRRKSPRRINRLRETGRVTWSGAWIQPCLNSLPPTPTQTSQLWMPMHPTPVCPPKTLWVVKGSNDRDDAAAFARTPIGASVAPATLGFSNVCSQVLWNVLSSEIIVFIPWNVRFSPDETPDGFRGAMSALVVFVRCDATM